MKRVTGKPVPPTISIASRPGAMTTRDVVFLAVIAACVTAAGMVVVPLVGAAPLPGMRALVAAFFYGFFLAIGLLKVRKRGAVFLVALFNGLVLLMMSWLMLANNLVAGLATELLVLAVFRDYQSEKAILLGAGTYICMSLPASFLMAAWLGGPAIGRFLTHPAVVAPIFLGTAALSFGGAWAGLKLGRELIKAGVIKN